METINNNKKTWVQPVVQVLKINSGTLSGNMTGKEAGGNNKKPS